MSDTAEVANLRSGLIVSAMSIAWTVIASALAIGIGLTVSSLVLVAFGCTGLLDAAGSVALVAHFRHALRHETFSQRHERVAFRVVMGGLVLVACVTAVESVAHLLNPGSPEHSLAGIGVAAASVVALSLLARRKISLGRAIPSQALVADGLLSTMGAVLGFVTVVGTLLAALGWWWADPVAALVVAIGALVLAAILARE